MKNQNTSIEIDVLALLNKLWNKKFLITLIAVFTASIMLLVSLFLMTPSYTSTTSFYVGNQKSAGENLTAQDLQAGDYLVRDYKEIITSKDVRQQVIKKEKLSLSADELLKKINVSIPANTRIITISVEDINPNKAAKLANAVRIAASDKIKDVTKVDNVEEVDPAEAPDKPSSPNIKRNVVLGFLLGGFIAVASILVGEALDDRVKRPEDVEEVLGIPLLGIVPNADKMK